MLAIDYNLLQQLLSWLSKTGMWLVQVVAFTALLWWVANSYLQQQQQLGQPLRNPFLPARSPQRVSPAAAAPGPIGAQGRKKKGMKGPGGPADGHAQVSDAGLVVTPSCWCHQVTDQLCYAHTIAA